MVNIRIPATEMRRTRVIIINSTGATLADIERFSDIFSPIQISMKNYAPGYYTIAVTHSGKTGTTRVVKL